MTQIVTAADAAEFLALVPHLAGYVPRQSVVMVPFRGARTIGVMRVDLPDDADDDTLAQMASTLVGLVCRVEGADAVALVTYTDRSCRDGLPHRGLADAIGRRAHLCGLRLTDALCVGSDGWGSYLDAGCPADGRPLGELAAPSVGDRAAAVEPSQSAGATLATVDDAETTLVQSALTELERALGTVSALREAWESNTGDADPRSAAARSAAELLDDLPLRFERALHWDLDAIDPDDAAALLWCLHRPIFRDVALVQWCSDLSRGDATLTAQLDWHEGADIPADLGGVLVGDGPAPDRERIGAALALTRRVAASAPQSHRAGILSACAWLAWATGRSTHAAEYAQQARRADPDHTFAQIVLAFVDAGHMPAWAFHRPDPRAGARRGERAT